MSQIDLQSFRQLICLLVTVNCSLFIEHFMILRDVASRKGFTKSGSWFAKPRFHPHEACSHQRASRSSTQGIDAAQMEEIQQEHSFVKDPKLITGRDEPVATQG